MGIMISAEVGTFAAFHGRYFSATQRQREHQQAGHHRSDRTLPHNLPYHDLNRNPVSF